MQRYFIYLGYDGSAYHGWQVQPNGESVQGTLERALGMLLRREVAVTGAGRTDAGVHARLMVAHFDWEEGLVQEGMPMSVEREECRRQEVKAESIKVSEEHGLEGEEALEQAPATRGEETKSDEETERGLPDEHDLTDKLNRLLPPDIAVYGLRRVRPDAHARFSATSRTYQYFVTTRKSPFDRQYCLRLIREPDFAAMNAAARRLIDYTDFTSFSKLHTDVKTNNCRIMHAQWTDCGDGTWAFTIRADRFLRNMVRAIVGTLLEVGRGRMTVEGFCRVVEQRDRCRAGMSVPGHALFLTDISYPEEIFLDV